MFVETNLKKQGILPLTFQNSSDYDKIAPSDRVSLTGLGSLAPGKPVKAVFTRKDGSTYELVLNHTMNQNQIEWFKAGSALNQMAKTSKQSNKK